MSKSIELDRIISAVTHDVGYPGEGPTTLGDWAEEFARRVLSIQQEADAKDAERFRWLLSRWFGEHGGWDFKNALTPEEVIAELDTAMATPTDSEAKQ